MNMKENLKRREFEVNLKLDELKGYDPKQVTDMIMKGFNPKSREVTVNDPVLVKKIANLKFGLGAGKDKIVQVHINK